MSLTRPKFAQTVLAVAFAVLCVGLLARPAAAASGELGGKLYEDLNANGTQDPGEPAIKGVSVDLIHAGPDGSLGTTDDEYVGEVRSKQDGRYGFADLPKGLYRQVVVNAQVTVGDNLPAEPVVSDVRVAASGSSAKDISFVPMPTVDKEPLKNGMPSLRPAAMRGMVYEDLNDNGTRDVGESGIEGVVVTLDGGTSTQKSDNKGYFEFPDLKTGSYKFSVNPDDQAVGKRKLVTPKEVTATLRDMESRPTFGFRDPNAPAPQAATRVSRSSQPATPTTESSAPARSTPEAADDGELAHTGAGVDRLLPLALLLMLAGAGCVTATRRYSPRAAV